MKRVFTLTKNHKLKQVQLNEKIMLHILLITSSETHVTFRLTAAVTIQFLPIDCLLSHGLELCAFYVHFMCIVSLCAFYGGLLIGFKSLQSSQPAARSACDFINFLHHACSSADVIGRFHLAR